VVLMIPTVLERGLPREANVGIGPPGDGAA
jgi:hypothetical protein